MNGTATTTTVAAGSTIGLNVAGNPSTMYHDGVSDLVFFAYSSNDLCVTAGAQRVHGQGAEHGSRWMDADRQCLVQSVPDYVSVFIDSK